MLKANDLKLKVIAPEQKHLTKEEVLKYLNQPGVVKWIEAKDLLGDANDACVDGREKGNVIATPGGDVALLAETIVSVGKLSGKKLNPFEVRQVFRWRVKEFGSFYMHTDEHALKNLIKSLNQDETVIRERGKFEGIDQVLEFIREPDNLQTSLMSHLFVPDNIGCGHLNRMIRNPEAYGMSTKVIRSTMRAFFNMMWNGLPEEKENINFQVLKGDHFEGAVLLALVEDELITQKTMIPAIKPTDGKTSIFVYHPQVSRFMHRKESVALAQSGLIPEISKDMANAFEKMMTRVGSVGARETVARLAFDLPQYKIVFPYLG